MNVQVLGWIYVRQVAWLKLRRVHLLSSVNERFDFLLSLAQNSFLCFFVKIFHLLILWQLYQFYLIFSLPSKHFSIELFHILQSPTLKHDPSVFNNSLVWSYPVYFDARQIVFIQVTALWLIWWLVENQLCLLDSNIWSGRMISLMPIQLTIPLSNTWLWRQLQFVFTFLLVIHDADVTHYVYVHFWCLASITKTWWPSTWCFDVMNCSHNGLGSILRILRRRWQYVMNQQIIVIQLRFVTEKC